MRWLTIDKNFNQNTLLFKAFADDNRLLIIEMLSCGELCACKILEKLNITQSTLSHHMKILSGSNLVNIRKEGKWAYYSLNDKIVGDFLAFISSITSYKATCICAESEEVK